MQAPQKNAVQATLRVEVLRSFYVSGKVIPAKAEVELPRVFALEMIAANKVRAVIETNEAQFALNPHASEEKADVPKKEKFHAR